MYLAITKTKQEIENILIHKYKLCKNCSKQRAEFVYDQMIDNNFRVILLSFAMGGIKVEISDFLVGESPLVMN